MKAMLFALGLVAGACAAPLEAPVAPPPRQPDAAERMADQTVALVVETRTGVRPYCSGVWVGPYVIVTAAHCVDGRTKPGGSVEYVVRSDVFDGTRPRVRMRTRPAEVAVIDAAHDLALVHAPGAPPHLTAYVSLSEVRPGSFAQAMGHPLGQWYTYSSGDVSAVAEYDAGDVSCLWVQATTPIDPGSSGGGLFDAGGALIGITSRKITSAQAIAFFVHWQYVDALLRTGVS